MEGIYAFGQHDKHDRQSFAGLMVVFPICDFCWQCNPDGSFKCHTPATCVDHTDDGPLFTCDQD